MMPRFLFLSLLLCSPMLALAELETWTDRNGRTMEAELIDATPNMAVFRKAQGDTYRVRIRTLSDADQERVLATVERFDAEREERVGRRRRPAASAEPNQAGQSAQTPPAPASETAKPKPAPDAPRLPAVTQNIAESLVSVKDNAFVPVSADAVKPIKYYGVYFAAGWSGASRTFTHELVAAYSALKAKYPEFEMVFFSFDESEADMLAFMTEEKMPWPAIGFGHIKTATALRKHRGQGVPNLVFLTAQGKPLASSYVKAPSEKTPSADAKEAPPAKNTPPAAKPPAASTPKAAPAAKEATPDPAPSAKPKPADIYIYEGPRKVLAFIQDYLANPPPPPKPAAKSSSKSVAKPAAKPAPASGDKADATAPKTK